MVVQVESTEAQKRSRCIDLMLEVVKANPNLVDTMGDGKLAATVVINGAKELQAFLYPEK
jgi:hypothetical protein